MICKKCKSSKIKKRQNYSHGKKSKAVVSLVCMACGSADIDKQEDYRGRRGFRRR